MGTLIWKGAVMARESISVYERAPGIFHLPIYPFKAIIPIAALLFLAQGLIWILKENEDKKD
jgi:TRAP-type mannitol/chloroaromatic compound transport system permease small subunit